jgi:L-threonylcarbamoyladenylate synthase
MGNVFNDQLRSYFPMTEIIRVRRALHRITRAAQIIRNGGTVAFPTETVYGLGADALNSRAVRKIFAAKGRPPDNPLIVHIAHKEDVAHLVREIPPHAKKLMDTYWPGPLTLVFKKAARVPKIVTAGLDTVAVRMPAHPVARALIHHSARPIAAPSANISGRPSSTHAEHVIRDLRGKVDAIVDGGATPIGIESTVLDVSRKVPTLLRPGGITLEQLRATVGRVVDASIVRSSKPKSPGMKYQHYKPRADVLLFEGKNGAARLAEKLCSLHAQGHRVAVISKRKIGVSLYAATRSEKDLAKHLFSLFRDFDSKGAEYILVEGVSDTHLGRAVMNRLRKAASQIIK